MPSAQGSGPGNRWRGTLAQVIDTMRFTHPEFLWLLGLALPLVLLHLWTRRPRPRVVPSLALWQRTLAAQERRFGVRRVRRLVSLLVHLLALALFTLGAARPRPAEDPPSPRALVIVTDLSASMAARDGGAGLTRMQAARWRAHEVLEGLDPVDRVAVVGAGRRPRLLLPLTAGPWRAKRLLAALDPGEPAADLRAALELARTIARDLEDAKLLVLTDRAGVRQGLPEDLPRIVVGTSDTNAGIAGLRVEQRWGQPRARVFVRVRNASETRLHATLSVRWLLRMDAEGREVGQAAEAGSGPVRAAIPLAPRSITNVELEIPAGQGGLLSAHLDAGDPLGIDDEAYAVVFPHPKPRVVVVAEGEPDPFLVGALDVLSDSLDTEESFLTTPRGLQDLALHLGSSDVVIFDRCSPDVPLPLRNVVTFGAEGEHAPVRADDEVRKLAPWTWDRHHPLLAQVSLDALRVGKGRVLVPADGDSVLVRAEKGPILVAGERGPMRVVAFGFAAKDSNLPLLVAYPLLLKNLFSWFAFDRWLAFRTEGRVGEPIGVGEGFREGTTSVELDYEGRWGVRRRTWVCEVEGGVPLLPECPWPGFYRIRWAGGHQWVAVNFQGPEESALEAAGEDNGPRLPRFTRREAAEFDPESMWLHLTVAGMALMVIEWVVFHRGGGV